MVSEDGQICTAHHNGKQGNNDKGSSSQSQGAGDSRDRLKWQFHHLFEAGKVDNIPHPRFQRAEVY